MTAREKAIRTLPRELRGSYAFPEKRAAEILDALTDHIYEEVKRRAREEKDARLRAASIGVIDG